MVRLRSMLLADMATRAGPGWAKLAWWRRGMSSAHSRMSSSRLSRPSREASQRQGCCSKLQHAHGVSACRLVAAAQVQPCAIAGCHLAVQIRALWQHEKLMTAVEEGSHESRTLCPCPYRSSLCVTRVYRLFKGRAPV